MKTKYFNYNTTKTEVSTNAKSDDLTDALTKAVKLNKRILSCECGSADLEYQGVGKYICRACHKETFDNYGKVRQCVNGFEVVSMAEIMTRTGLTRAEINELVREGSIRVVSGMVGVK